MVSLTKTLGNQNIFLLFEVPCTLLNPFSEDLLSKLTRCREAQKTIGTTVNGIIASMYTSFIERDLLRSGSKKQ